MELFKRVHEAVGMLSEENKNKLKKYISRLNTDMILTPKANDEFKSTADAHNVTAILTQLTVYVNITHKEKALYVAKYNALVSSIDNHKYTAYHDKLNDTLIIVALLELIL